MRFDDKVLRWLLCFFSCRMLSHMLTHLLALPVDVLELISEYHQGLCVSMATKIQLWWKFHQKKDFCDDCKVSCHEQKLRVVPACADYQIMGHYCCTKRVCAKGCLVHCKAGHPNLLKHDDGFLYPRMCSWCNEGIGFLLCLQSTWHGDISPKTARARYW